MGKIDRSLVLTDKERLLRTCANLDVDRLPYWVWFGPWGDTMKRWRGEGLGDMQWQDCHAYFNMDKGFLNVPVELGYYPRFEYRVLEEDENTVTYVNYMGVKEQGMKHGATIPRTLENPVSTPEDWERLKRERLNPMEPARFPSDWPERVREMKESGWAIQIGGYPYGLFGTVREILGVERTLYGFYDEPRLIHDIMDYLTDFWLAIYEKVSEDIQIDHIHIWEDMSGKSGPLISPDMFREFMTPNYKKIARFAREHDIPVISVDTDGNMDALMPLLREAGVTLVLPFEVQAGCDVLEYKRQYPEMTLLGGIDKRMLTFGEKEIDEELDRISPLFKQSGYIPGLDHLIHPQISFQNFSYYMKRLREML